MRNLPRLKRQMKRLRISQHFVAEVAGVSRPMVNRVVNGAGKSARVVAIIEQLIAERQRKAS